VQYLHHQLHLALPPAVVAVVLPAEEAEVVAVEDGDW
jgi:hypothetical protein